MDLGFQLNIGQRMEQKLAPQMIQSLKLLQVNSLELEMMVKQELEINPILEIEEIRDDLDNDESSEIDDDFDEDAPRAAEDIDWDSYYNEGVDLGYTPPNTHEDYEESFEHVSTYAKNMQDILLEQLHDRELNHDVSLLVEYLIYSLDDEGFLKANLVDDDSFMIDAPDAEELRALYSHPEIKELELVIRDELSLYESSHNVREAFGVLWSFEPIGIGARNLQECLILQATRKNFTSELPMRILKEGFEMFSKVQVSGLAKKLDVSSDEIQQALKQIAELDPKPGRQIGGESAPMVTPDLFVFKKEGEWIVALNDRSVPKLQISNTYLHLIQKGSKAPKQDKQFIRDKLNTANWLIRSIEQRKSSILRVMQAILEEQKEFFEKGPAFLKPLILQNIADKVEMHISTVNRVTNGKYVQTEAGLFELKTFFSSSVKQEDGSEISATQTREAIRRLIESEDPKDPLSDQKIADLLGKENLEVARRTVAKYREQMDIMPARLRKKF